MYLRYCNQDEMCSLAWMTLLCKLSNRQLHDIRHLLWSPYMQPCFSTVGHFPPHNSFAILLKRFRYTLCIRFKPKKVDCRSSVVCQGYCLDASSYEQVANFANAELYFSSVLMSVYSLQFTTSSSTSSWKERWRLCRHWKWCCLNSGVTKRGFFVRHWSFSCPHSYISITWHARSHTAGVKVTWVKMFSSVVFDFPMRW